MLFDLLLSVLLVQASPPPEIVERIVAVVDDRPVLLSEARLVAELKGLELGLAVDVVVEEILMYREASRLPQARVSPEAEERAVETLKEKAPEAPITDLRRLARRQATIVNYVDFRFRPEIRITDEVVDRTYEQRFPIRSTSRPPRDEAAIAIRKELTDRALGQKIEAWVKDLRSAAQIRYNP